MKSRVMILAMLAMCAAGQLAAAQLAEQMSAIEMNDTLNDVSGGPSGQVVDQVREDLGQGGRNQPAPAANVNNPQTGDQQAGLGQTPAGEAPAVAGAAESGTAEKNGFKLTNASQLANDGITHLRNMRFNEAVAAYRQAKQADPRYEEFFAKAKYLRKMFNQGNLDTVKFERVREGQELTWGQLLDWDRVGTSHGKRTATVPGQSGLGGENWYEDMLAAEEGR